MQCSVQKRQARDPSGSGPASQPPAGPLAVWALRGFYSIERLTPPVNRRSYKEMRANSDFFGSAVTGLHLADGIVRLS